MAIGVALYAFSYFAIQHGFLSSKGNLVDQLNWQIGFYLHFIGGGIALGVGWSQFWAGLRNRNIQLHRTLGGVYVTSVLIAGAPSGIYLALFANGGFSNNLGFGMMGILWFFTTMKALIHIRNSEIDLHKVWMIRSYALCLAAVTLRIWLPLFIISGVSFNEAYLAVGWFCWVPNIIVAEWVISKQLVKD